jgi:hypothetical protein
MYQSAPSPVSIVKRKEQDEQENQTTRKRALAELNADDHEEGEIFDEPDNNLDEEFFSSLHPDRKKLRLTSTTDLRGSLALRTVESQTAGWRGIDLEDQMGWINEQEAPFCLGDVSFRILCSFANNYQQHLLCRLPKLSQETRFSSVRSTLIESVPCQLIISRV